MGAVSQVRSVELFHLLFLAQLVRRVDKAAVVVKGGSNLRFFHRSIRYSEDMDLDVGEVGTLVLREKVREVLASRPFADILGARRIRIEHVTEHRQAERWKLGLRVDGAPMPLPTKIEFSRRGLEEGVVFGSVDPDVVRVHQLPPLMASHYDAAAAFRQKAGALAGRRQTQARDVFDLHRLHAAAGAASALEHVDARVIDRACANAMSVDFGMFKSQVLAFLLPKEQAQFDSASVWDTIVLEVVESLRTLRP
jgi:predicted nucleotidyltransferase component of viral defense system